MLTEHTSDLAANAERVRLVAALRRGAHDLRGLSDAVADPQASTDEVARARIKARMTARDLLRAIGE